VSSKWGWWVLYRIVNVTDYKNGIKKWPQEERPREKLANLGPQSLSSAELLAILLSNGTANLNALDIGKELLKKFDSIGNLSQATLQELREIEGIGPAKAITLQAAFQLSKNIQREIAEDKVTYIRNPADVAKIFIPQLGQLKQEVFAIALLDSSGKYMFSRNITRGIINASLIHPREVFRLAIKEAATAVILAHNHPSGQLKPSNEDLAITRQLVDAGKLIGIPVKDHLIIAGNGFLSLNEEGYI
jgi:DNA repair protein RadC